jgi:hypothetical protein
MSQYNNYQKTGIVQLVDSVGYRPDYWVWFLAETEMFLFSTVFRPVKLFCGKSEFVID